MPTSCLARWVVAALAVGLSACFRQCPERKRNYAPALDSSFLSYFAAYRDGSRWIYRDSASGRLDTVFLENYARRTSPAFPGECDYFENITYELVGFQYPAGRISFTGTNRGVVPKATFSVYSTSFAVSYRDGAFFQDTAAGGGSVALLPALRVAGNPYAAVLRVAGQPVGNATPYTAYFAPGVGVVRWETESGVYDLINYQLTK